MDATTIAADDWKKAVETMRQGRVPEALAQLAAFVKAYPNSFEGHNFLGIALAQTGRNPEAISCLLKATRLNPQNAQAQYNLGKVYVRADRPDRARAAFQTALQLDPGYTAAQQALAAVPVPAASMPPVDSPLTTPASGVPASAAPASTRRPQAQMPGAMAPLASTAVPGVAQAAPMQTAPASTAPTRTVPAKPSVLDKIRDGLAPANPAEAAEGATAIDLAKAFGVGTVAAILGASIWYGIVMVTQRQLGIVAAGVGILVGLGVQVGASGKNGVSVAFLGALLAAIAMMSGEVLIINSVLANLGSDVRLTAITDVFTVDPVFTLFFGIGVWRAWQTNAE